MERLQLQEFFDSDLPTLAAEAAKQWTLQHNPRELGESDLLALYRSVL